MKKILQLRRIYLLALFPISILIIFLVKQFTIIAEQIFALRIYKWFAQLISLITGIFPFSVAELLIITLPFFVMYCIIRFLIGIIKNKQDRGFYIAKGIINILCTGSVLLFAFVILGGTNYYRYTFGNYSNLEVRDSSVDELYALTESLAKQANELRELHDSTDDNGVFQLSMSISEMTSEGNKAMRLLAEEYPVMGGYFGKSKPILFSPILSYTEITGIFIPFTVEANINVDIPHYSIPATMLHEQAHQRGFMREDEANFIAYLAGMKSEKVDLRYSATMLALISAGNALYRQSPDQYFEIRDQYSEEVLKDIRANSEYWVRFQDTVISTVSTKINDTYLKANAQEDGVKSYGRMVDLLLAQYREEVELKVK